MSIPTTPSTPRRVGSGWKRSGVALPGLQGEGSAPQDPPQLRHCARGDPSPVVPAGAPCMEPFNKPHASSPPPALPPPAPQQCWGLCWGWTPPGTMGGHRAGCRGSPARRVSMGENERERRGSTAPAGHVPTEKGWVGSGHSLHGDHAQGCWGEQRQVRGAGSIHPQPGRSHSSINSIMHRPRGWWCRAGCGPASPGEQHPQARWGRSKGRRHSPQEQGASRHLLPASPQGQGVLGVLPACTAQLIDGV